MGDLIAIPGILRAGYMERSSAFKMVAGGSATALAQVLTLTTVSASSGLSILTFATFPSGVTITATSNEAVRLLKEPNGERLPAIIDLPLPLFQDAQAALRFGALPVDEVAVVFTLLFRDRFNEGTTLCGEFVIRFAEDTTGALQPVSEVGTLISG